MNFGEKIKSIRTKEKLTQEQFAMKLNVSRQAVSNWENNKNFPDIEMLILISDVFHISLDELIKGDNQMNDIKEKIIKDGSETKRARYNMITSILATFLLLMGILLFVIKANSVEYIDADGFLHENFFLIPCGYLCIFSSFILFVSIGFRTIITKLRRN